MKKLLLATTVLLVSCQQPPQDDSEQLKSTIQSLQKANEECVKAKLDLETGKHELELSKANLFGSMKDLEKQVVVLEEKLKQAYRKPARAKPDMHDGGKVKDIEKLGEGLQGASGSK